MIKSLGFRLLSVFAFILAGCALWAESVIVQHPRDIPIYPTAVQSYRGLKAKIAVYPLPVAGEMLTRALTNNGCRVVAALPQCGAKAKDRPDCILEPISLTSKTERNGERVSLVTVLLVRVRKPVAVNEDARGRTFQGASRIELGFREPNSRGETETLPQEDAEGVRLAVDNLLRIPALKTAIEDTVTNDFSLLRAERQNRNEIKKGK